MRQEGAFGGFNEARRREVLGIVALRPMRKNNHVIAVVGPDGKVTKESAMKGFICCVCHKSEFEIEDCRDGQLCVKS